MIYVSSNKKINLGTKYGDSQGEKDTHIGKKFSPKNNSTSPYN